MLLRRLFLAALLTGLVLLARRAPAPPLVDAATGAAFSGARLEPSALHVALTPFSSLADALDCSSARQKVAWALFLLALFGPFRFFILGHGERWTSAERVLPALGLYLCVLAAGAAWAALARPAARLALDDPDLLAVDFDSPSPAAGWHARAGFAAAFVSGPAAQDAMRESRRRWEAGERGAPISLAADPGALRGAAREALTAETGDDARARLVADCRGENRFMVASAGPRRLASAACGWNVVRAHGWRLMPPLELRDAILSGLASDGYSGARVATRARVDPASGNWGVLLDPARACWLCARGWSRAEASAAIAWAWALPLAAAFGA